MSLISIGYSLSFFGLYLSIYFWGAFGIDAACKALNIGTFWPLFIYTFVMTGIHILRFLGKKSFLHSTVPVLYTLSMLFLLPGGRTDGISLFFCIAISLISVALNISVLQYFVKAQREKVLGTVKFKSFGDRVHF